MTSQFPDLNSNQLVKIAEKAGFKFIRQTGSSHAIYEREIKGVRQFLCMEKHIKKRKTVKSICNDLGITIDELIELQKR